jgi:hypothetical protein
MIDECRLTSVDCGRESETPGEVGRGKSAIGNRQSTIADIGNRHSPNLHPLPIFTGIVISSVPRITTTSTVL